MELTNQTKKNRIKSQENVGYSEWCRGCDRAVVPAGKKCPICGHKKYIKYKVKI